MKSLSGFQASGMKLAKYFAQTEFSTAPNWWIPYFFTIGFFPGRQVELLSFWGLGESLRTYGFHLHEEITSSNQNDRARRDCRDHLVQTLLELYQWNNTHIAIIFPFLLTLETEGEIDQHMPISIPIPDGQLLQGNVAGKWVHRNTHNDITI